MNKTDQVLDRIERLWPLIAVLGALVAGGIKLKYDIQDHSAMIKEHEREIDDLTHRLIVLETFKDCHEMSKMSKH